MRLESGCEPCCELLRCLQCCTPHSVQRRPGGSEARLPGGPPHCPRPDLLAAIFAFKQNKGGEFAAPLTSFDWNELDPRRIGTASIDTTCTVRHACKAFCLGVFACACIRRIGTASIDTTCTVRRGARELAYLLDSPLLCSGVFLVAAQPWFARAGALLGSQVCRVSHTCGLRFFRMSPLQ